MDPRPPLAALGKTAAGFLAIPGGGAAFAAGAQAARLAAPREAGFWELRQTHSALWREVKDGAPPFGTEGDALFTGEREAVLAVKTADCLPLLFHAPDTGEIAAVHAGWRGLAQDLPVIVARALAARGAAPGKLRIALGPAICGRCYEVGDEFRATFAPFGSGAWLAPGPSGKLHFDQCAFARARLREAGVPGENLFDAGLCVKESGLPSHRRDGADCGRLFSMVWKT